MSTVEASYGHSEKTKTAIIFRFGDLPNLLGARLLSDAMPNSRLIPVSAGDTPDIDFIFQDADITDIVFIDDVVSQHVREAIYKHKRVGSVTIFSNHLEHYIDDLDFYQKRTGELTLISSHHKGEHYLEQLWQFSHAVKLARGVGKVLEMPMIYKYVIDYLTKAGRYPLSADVFNWLSFYIYARSIYQNCVTTEFDIGHVQKLIFTDEECTRISRECNLINDLSKLRLENEAVNAAMVNSLFINRVSSTGMPYRMIAVFFKDTNVDKMLDVLEESFKASDVVCVIGSVINDRITLYLRSRNDSLLLDAEFKNLVALNDDGKTMVYRMTLPNFSTMLSLAYSAYILNDFLH